MLPDCVLHSQSCANVWSTQCHFGLFLYAVAPKLLFGVSVSVSHSPSHILRSTSLWLCTKGPSAIFWDSQTIHWTAEVEVFLNNVLFEFYEWMGIYMPDVHFGTCLKNLGISNWTAKCDPRQHKLQVTGIAGVTNVGSLWWRATGLKEKQSVAIWTMGGATLFSILPGGVYEGPELVACNPRLTEIVPSSFWAATATTI